MNDLTPPLRRPIPPHVKAAMRARVHRELDSGAPVAARGSRLLVPAIAAAAALAVIAVGGYASVTGEGGTRGAGFASNGDTEPPVPQAIDPQQPDDDCLIGELAPADGWDAMEPLEAPDPDGGSLHSRDRSADDPGEPLELPQGQVEALPADPEDGDEPPPAELESGTGVVCDSAPMEGGASVAMVEPSAPTSTVVADPARVYERCAKLVAEELAYGGITTGRLAIENGPATTVVVSSTGDGERAFVCHLTPDAEHVSTAEDGLQISGRAAWAGGPVPRGADGLGYGFEHGEEMAVVSDRWWAVQTTSPDPITESPMQWLYATAEGSLAGEGTICDADEPDC